MSIVIAVKQQKISSLEYFFKKRSLLLLEDIKLLRNISLQQIQYSRKKHESQSQNIENLYLSLVFIYLTSCPTNKIFFNPRKSILFSFSQEKTSLTEKITDFYLAK